MMVIVTQHLEPMNVCKISFIHCIKILHETKKICYPLGIRPSHCRWLVFYYWHTDLELHLYAFACVCVLLAEDDKVVLYSLPGAMFCHASFLLQFWLWLT